MDERGVQKPLHPDDSQHHIRVRLTHLQASTGRVELDARRGAAPYLEVEEERVERRPCKWHLGEAGQGWSVVRS